MNLSIIIVNYNMDDCILKCIESIYKETVLIKYEIIVIDNNSSDTSMKKIKMQYPNILLKENSDNLGFSVVHRALKCSYRSLILQ